MHEFCGEIIYEGMLVDAGVDVKTGWVHSDICWHTDKPTELHENYIKFLHDCLDEWLTKSNGTGAFWVGDPQYFKDWEKD